MIKKSIIFLLSFGITFYYQSDEILPETGGDQRCGNPYDWEPDDEELQACLDGGGLIELIPAHPGYMINGLHGDVRRGLHITRSATTLTATDGKKAKVFAGRDFYGTILKTVGDISHFAIRNIIFDGMVDEFVDHEPYRKRRHECSVGGDLGNVFLHGSNFHFENSASINAMCGSGLGVLGYNFFVVNNDISRNGRDKYAWYQDHRRGFPWADGLTALFCEHGYIAHNTFTDNTDIDLVVGGGKGCQVLHNTIVHDQKYAFAGLNIGNYSNHGDHSESVFMFNKVFSVTVDKLAMGILVGSHPWDVHRYVKNAGLVAQNESHGNVFNLIVDGVWGGVIKDNTVYNPLGTDTNCSREIPGINFGVNLLHIANVVIEGDWTPYQYDQWSCNPL